MLIANTAFAAPRAVKRDQVARASVKVKVGKKTKKYNIYCLKTVPGQTKTVKKKLVFTSYKDSIAKLKRSRQTKAVKAQISLSNAIYKAGVKTCKEQFRIKQNPPPQPTPPGGPTGDYLSLEAYTGTFGPDEAHVLFNRFGFGATPSDLQAAVASGLAATIERLLTPVSEPAIDAAVEDLNVDNWLASDPLAGSGNVAADPNNINSLSRNGLRTAVLYRFVNSRNTFFNRLAFFLMDERMATSHNAARDCELHAIKTYSDNVFKNAFSGDYMQYMRDMNTDHLLHLRWLDGSTNRGGPGGTPNENYAREFWELGTVGPTGLNGLPVYGDLDIAQGALAFTGYNINETTINGNYTCLAAYVPGFHRNGSKTVFIGTPYQARVENAAELLEATARHPRMAEHLAEDIWKTFINPYATATQIQQLAQIIRDNGYQLIPVFRRIMSSQAVFAGPSRRSIIKQPLDITIGFIRNSGFPLYYRNYDSLLSRQEQQVLNAPTVFGWDEKYLSGQQMQIEWWNAFIDTFININLTQLKQNTGWSYYDRFVGDLHNASGPRTSTDIITRVAHDLGVVLNAAQMAELNQMMNFYLTRSNCPAQCGGMSYRLVRRNYDTSPTATESGYSGTGQRRIRLLMTAIMQLPETRLK